MPLYLFKNKDHFKVYFKLFLSFCFCCISTFTIYWQYSAALSKNSRVAYVEKKKESVGLKYILRWRASSWSLWKDEKQRSFTKRKCPKTNCYVTGNRRLFKANITKFDAILFDACDMVGKIGLPKARSPRQKYILYSYESAHRFPIRNKIYDGFFNWTMTYKLDSDIVTTYFHIKNNIGEIIGPKRDMEWIAEADMKGIDDHLAKRLRTKTKAAAWFVSDCMTLGRRDLYVTSLKKHLQKYNLSVDVYGRCGPLRCARYDSKCDAMLDKDYYFYMALENSFAEDYVTEKLLRAMQNNVVPIVYGAANYSRFLPPGSYIDARAHSAPNLADIMHNLVRSPAAYSRYFKWKNYYTYHDSTQLNICKLCEVMNDVETVRAFSVHNDIRHWWNSNFSRRMTKRPSLRRKGGVKRGRGRG